MYGVAYCAGGVALLCWWFRSCMYGVAYCAGGVAYCAGGSDRVCTV